MKNSFFVVLAVMVMLVSSSCAPDPRNQADADATTRQSQQATLDAEQKRAQAAAEWQQQQAFWKEIFSDLVAVWKAAIPIFATIFSFAVCFVVLSITYSASYTAIGLGRVAVKTAEFRARQIPLNPETFTFPALISPDEKYLLDLNTKTAMAMGATSEPNADMVESLRARAEVVMQDYQAAHAWNGSKVLVQREDGDDERI
jgi:hypothetical protein